jgi:hypothetical protein
MLERGDQRDELVDAWRSVIGAFPGPPEKVYESTLNVPSKLTWPVNTCHNVCQDSV